MSYEFYNSAFIVALVLSVIMLIVTVLLFFLLNIRTAIGDITGLGKRKAVENMQNKGKATKNDNRLANKDNSAGKAESITQGSVKTSKISPQDRYDTLEASETSLLAEQPGFETTVLNSEETGVGASVEAVEQNEQWTGYADFYVEYDITYVHSNEVIR